MDSTALPFPLLRGVDVLGPASSPRGVDVLGPASSPREDARANETEIGVESVSPNAPALALASIATTRETLGNQSGDGHTLRRAYFEAREAVRQHLVIVTGDATRARTVVRDLATAIDESTGRDGAPSDRAFLFKQARDAAFASGSRALSSDDRIAWQDPVLTRRSRTRAVSYCVALRRLRTELPASARELLDLVHARELTSHEVAYVLALAGDDVPEGLAIAEVHAARILRAELGRDAPDVGLAMLDAFAVSRDDAVAQVEPMAPGTILGGRYRIDHRVGAGAFGDVYRADDCEVAGHTVALKILHGPAHTQVAKENALRELRHIAAVSHPSIVQFKDHGWHEHRLWFVMPWYVGETLAQRIARSPLTRAEARDIFAPLARALEAMHASGVRHQDVKPDNIFLAKLPGGAVLPVLLDLGVAASDADRLLAGTPTYLAPEVAARFVRTRCVSSAQSLRARACDQPSQPQALAPSNTRWLGRRDVAAANAPQRYVDALTSGVAARSDVFSLALSLRNALEPDTREDVTGSAVDRFMSMRAEASPEPPVAREMRFLAPTFRRWLSRDPLERPSAAELADELQILTSPEERRERRMRTLRWLAPLMTTLIGVFALVVWIFAERAARESAAAKNARTKITSVEREHRSLMSGFAALERQFFSSQLSRDELASRLASTTSRLDASDQALRRQIEHNQTVNVSLTTERERATVLTGQLAAAEASSRALGQSLAALTAEHSSVRDTLARTRDDLSRAQAEIGSRMVELTGVRQRLELAEADVTKLNEHNSAIDRQAEALRTQVEALRSQTATLQTALDTEREHTRVERVARERAETRVADLQARLEENVAPARASRNQRRSSSSSPTTPAPSID